MSLRILLADDSMTAQNMGKKILTDGGYDVVTVSNGAAAIKKLAEFTPDVIIADVYMPGYNGLEICERVKNAPATASVPVLLSVGKLEPFRPEEGLKVRADGIIIKPFEATDLLAVTAKLAERAGKHSAAAVAASAPEPPVAEPVVEEPVVQPPVAANAATQDLSEMPAFALEESAFAPVELEEAVAATPPVFAVENRQPDYVREFGLDAHDAPTTEFTTPDDSVAVPSPGPDSSEIRAGAETQVAPEPPPVAMPASVNLAINEVSLPEPAPDAAAAPEDDFEAKLAAAMAEYDAAPATKAVSDIVVEAPPAAHTVPAVAIEAAAAPSNSASVVEPLNAPAPEPTVHTSAEAVSDRAPEPSWIAEEAPLSEAEMGLSLEEELKAFAATANGGPAPSPVMPSGPLGDTTWDDEVAKLVEESKDRFFPEAPVVTSVADAPATAHSVQSETPTFTERVNAMLDDAGFPASMQEQPAAEADVLASLDIPPAQLAAEEVASPVDTQAQGVEDLPVEVASVEQFTVPDQTLDPLAYDVAALTSDQPIEATVDIPELALSDEADASAITAADIPELVTHDVPTGWKVDAALEASPVKSTSDGADTSIAARDAHTDTGVPVIDAPAVENDLGADIDDVLLTPEEVTSCEAPLTHASRDEGDARDFAPTSPVESERQDELVMMVEHATATATPEGDKHNVTAAVLDEAAIGEVVDRVMERLRGEIVAQIARELAAKLGD